MKDKQKDSGILQGAAVKHTPTPWFMESYGSDAFYISNDKSGHTIAKVGGKLLAFRKSQKANALFIVHAVNTYESNQQKINSLVSIAEEVKKKLLSYAFIMGEAETRRDVEEEMVSLAHQLQSSINLAKAEPF